MTLPHDKQARKERPIARGLLDYFPDACAEVAHLSYVGNKQHNPGEEMHWARDKSSDHADCIVRHLLERGKKDEDGVPHSAKVAWRALALLQLELEAREMEREAEEMDAEAETEKKQQPKRMFLSTPGIITDPRIQAAAGVDVASGESYTAVSTGGITHWVNQARQQGPGLSPLQQAMRRNLEERGCPPSYAALIAAGTSFPFAGVSARTATVYIAGPMTGYANFNFPAFDEARARFVTKRWAVISPADIDRADGIDGSDREFTNEDHRSFAFRDFHALHHLKGENGDAVAFLPDWERSTGAAAEFFLARWLRLAILDATTGNPLKAWDSTRLQETVSGFLLDQLDALGDQ